MLRVEVRLWLVCARKLIKVAKRSFSSYFQFSIYQTSYHWRYLFWDTYNIDK